MKTEEGAGRQPGLSTRAVHAGSPQPRPGQPVVMPVHQTSTFFTEAVPTGEVMYTRYGTNPNHVALASRLCALEGGEDAVVLGSGNAACTLALLSCVGAGGHVVAQRELYGGTLRLLRRELPRLGIASPSSRTARAGRRRCGTIAVRCSWKCRSIRRCTCPTSRRRPRWRGSGASRSSWMRRLPRPPTSDRSNTARTWSFTVLRNTWVDIRISRRGVVIGSAERVAEVRELLKSFGPVLDPHAVWLLERGVKTLAYGWSGTTGTGRRSRSGSSAPAGPSRSLSRACHRIPTTIARGGSFQGFGGVVSILWTAATKPRCVSRDACA
jgi:hypothetical protein